MAASTKSLFRATKPKHRVTAGQATMGDWPQQAAPEAEALRDPLDYDPTPPDATAAFLSVAGERLREIGGLIWEPAVGGGHMAEELARWGFDVIGSDIVDRGWPGTQVRGLYDFAAPPSGARIVVTNPPYCEVSARDGHGRWLRHLMGMDLDYVAMLLNADWVFARQNGMDELHARFPVSIEYKCCWKIDFRDGGSPPQRNTWFVWDRAWQGETVSRRLFREWGGRRAQGVLL